MPPTLPTDVDHRVTTALDPRDAGQVKSSGDARKSVSLLLRYSLAIFFRNSLVFCSTDSRKVYALLLLRNLAVTVSECLAIFDESVSAFFAGTTGLVIAAMIWLVQMIVAAFACASDRLAPGDPFNRHRFTGLVALECVVCAGAATNLYHSYEVIMSELHGCVAELNGASFFAADAPGRRRDGERGAGCVPAGSRPLLF